MANYEVKIIYDDEQSQATLTSLSFNYPANNYSKVRESLSGSALADFSEEKDGSNVFILGHSKLGYGDTFKDSYDGYIAKTIYTHDSEPLIVTLKGKNIQAIKLQFDSKINCIANRIRVKTEYEDTTITNFQFIAYYALEYAVDVVELYFYDWSGENPVMNLTSLALRLDLSYTKKNGLLSFTRGSESSTDIGRPTFGLVSQYGTIKIRDYNNLIENMANRDALYSALHLEILLDDTVIGTYATKEWSKAHDANEVTIELESEFTVWNDIQVDLPFTENETAYNLFKYLKAKSGGFVIKITSEQITYLQSIKMPYLYMERCSLFTAWNKFCNLTMLQMCPQGDGMIIFV